MAARSQRSPAADPPLVPPGAPLRSVAGIYALRHATHPREAIVVNRDLSSLDEPLCGEVRALRRRHERAIRGLIERGCAEGSFAVAEPALASFGILELCVSIAHWFRPDGPLTAEQVAVQYAEFAVRIALPSRDEAG